MQSVDKRATCYRNRSRCRSCNRVLYKIRRWWCRFITINGLTKRQGRALLQELGADERLYLKMPTADLLDEKPGQADETELGITYDQLDDYLEGKAVPTDVAEKIEKRYTVSEHKRQVPASMFDDWWK